MVQRYYSMEGKRGVNMKLLLADEQVKDPFQQIIRFWGRIPAAVASKILKNIISEYFQDTEVEKMVVLDPFGGSGSLIFEAAKLGANCIYSDVNPVFTFIAKTTISHVNIKKLEQTFKLLKQKILSHKYPLYYSNEIVKKSLMDLYKTKTNGKTYVISKTLIDPVLSLKNNWSDEVYTKLIMNGKTITKLAAEIYMQLKNSKQYSFSELRAKILKEKTSKDAEKTKFLFSKALRLLKRMKLINIEFKPFIIHFGKFENNKFTNIGTKNATNDDITLFKEIEEHIKPYFWYPNNKLKYPPHLGGRPFKKADAHERISELFTKRNLLALSILRHEIWSLPEKTYEEKIAKDNLKLCFLSILAQCSKMQHPNGGSWPVKSYWTPFNCIEYNVWLQFERKYKKILKLKKTLQSNGYVNIDKKIIFYTCNVLEIDKKVPRKSIDLIIAHPPYYSSIQYGELSYLWATWLDEKIPFEQEIVVNPQQFIFLNNEKVPKKGNIFEKEVKNAFQKLNLLLKDNGILSIIFNTRSQQRKQRFLKCVKEANFTITEIYRCPQIKMFKHGISKFIKENFVIICKKA